MAKTRRKAPQKQEKPDFGRLFLQVFLFVRGVSSDNPKTQKRCGRLLNELAEKRKPRKRKLARRRHGKAEN
ncbi:MAG: hypothetical protein HYV13_03890 [Candidatus Doudnabacteria bacterium]|nr:hypothetical protein [Candidatus Doudnabacteria bacterium]